MTSGYRIRELLTAKILPIPEGGFKGNRQILKYTKHYYTSTSLSTGIGSERIASYLGTRQSVGMYCDQETMLIASLDAKVLEAGQALEDVFTHFDKTIDLDTPYLYGNSRNFVCGPTQLTEAFGAYWYHPDHLGSSSYITNLSGEINQHMEYLPFGELLVEEHLNSYNSPFKFNAKEFDAETGNYYYGARYYDPKWVIWLSVDAEFARFPSYSPYNYTLLNPINLVDPDGNAPVTIIGADKKAQKNIRNQLPASSQKYVRFDKNGKLDASLLNQGVNENKNSGNYQRLAHLANSDDTYVYSTSENFTYFDAKTNEIKSEKFEKGMNVGISLYDENITTSSRISLDGNSHSIVSLLESDESQSKTTAHETVHLYLYDLMKNHGSEEDPNHRAKFENLETGELLMIRSNPPYIKEAENEAIKNYHENNN